jgi:hypothetical protein
MDKRLLKAFVRFDGSGRVVAGSLILRKKMPTVGKWKEITAYECCNQPTFDCNSYTLSVVRGESISYSYINCYGTPVGPIEVAGPVSILLCAVLGSVTYTGIATLELTGECTTTTSTTTTTTTAPPTTTTTTSTSTSTTTTTTTTL